MALVENGISKVVKKHPLFFILITVSTLFSINSHAAVSRVTGPGAVAPPPPPPGAGPAVPPAVGRVAVPPPRTAPPAPRISGPRGRVLPPAPRVGQGRVAVPAAPRTRRAVPLPTPGRARRVPLPTPGRARRAVPLPAPARARRAVPLPSPSRDRGIVPPAGANLAPGAQQPRVTVPRTRNITSVDQAEGSRVEQETIVVPPENLE